MIISTLRYTLHMLLITISIVCCFPLDNIIPKLTWKSKGLRTKEFIKGEKEQSILIPNIKTYHKAIAI